jgi:hypothetical protein
LFFANFADFKFGFPGFLFGSSKLIVFFFAWIRLVYCLNFTDFRLVCPYFDFDPQDRFLNFPFANWKLKENL